MMSHFEIQEQIPLFAVDGLSAQETARVAEHLAQCAACRALLSEYEFVAAELLETVPPATAPARIGVRLQNPARADTKQNAPIGTARNNFWNQSLALPRWAFALGVVAFLLLLGTVGAWGLQMQQRDAASQQVLSLLSARDLRFVELTSAGDAPSNNGFLCVASENSTALLWLYNLPPLDAASAYQVWLRDGTLRDNGGLFRADAQGRAVAVIRAPRPLNEYDEIGITVEPVGGSPAPTTPRVIGGKLD